MEENSTIFHNNKTKRRRFKTKNFQYRMYQPSLADFLNSDYENNVQANQISILTQTGNNNLNIVYSEMKGKAMLAVLAGYKNKQNNDLVFVHETPTQKTHNPLVQRRRPPFFNFFPKENTPQTTSGSKRLKKIELDNNQYTNSVVSSMQCSAKQKALVTANPKNEPVSNSLLKFNPYSKFHQPDD